MSSTDPGYDHFSTPVRRFGSAILRLKPEASALPTKAAINILGLHLDVSSGGVVDPPDYWYLTGTWNGNVTISGNSLELHLIADLVVHSTFLLSCDMVVALEEDGSGYFVPARVQPQQSAASYFRFCPSAAPASTDALLLDFGFFPISAPAGSTDWMTTSDGDIGFSAPQGNIWTDSNGKLPIGLKSGTGAWWLNLGTTRCPLSAAERAIVCECLSVVEGSNAAHTLLASMQSGPFEVPLTSLPGALSCTFYADVPEEKLPLSIEASADIRSGDAGRLAVTYAVSHYALQTDWKSGTPIPVLESLRLIPAPGSPGFDLESFATISSLGEPLTCSVPGSLPLWVRPSTPSRPGSLLLGYDTTSSGQVTVKAVDCIAWNKSLIFGLAPIAALSGISEPWPDMVPLVASRICKSFSLLYLFMEDQAVSVRVERTGKRWREAALESSLAADIANWNFSGLRLCLPMCPHGLLGAVMPSTRQAFLTDIEPDDGTLVAQPWDIRHDTRFHEAPGPQTGPGPVRLSSLTNVPDLEDFGGDPKLGEYDSVRSFGSLTIPKRVSPGDERKYDVFLRAESQSIRFEAVVPLEGGGRLTLSDGPIQLAQETEMAEWPALVAVYDAETSVADLLRTLKPSVLDSLERRCSGLFDTELFPKGWVGAILFGIVGHTVSSTGFELALGTDFPIGFVALTEGTSGATIVYSAQASQERDEQPAPDDQKYEAALDVMRFDLLVAKDRLVRMTSEIRLTVWSILGLGATGGSITVPLVSTVESDTLHIRAYLTTPITLLDGAQAPIRSVRIISAEGRVFEQGGFGLAINSEMVISPLTFGDTYAWFDTLDPNQVVQVQNLALMPRTDLHQGKIFLEPKYGSLLFPLSSDHFHLTDILGASVRITAMGVSWDGTIAQRRGEFEPLRSNNPPTGSAFWFEVELQTVALSLFAQSPGQGLVLRFMVQIPLSGGVTAPNDFWIGVSVAGVTNLTFELYRFLKLRAKTLRLGRTAVGSEEIPYLDIENAELEVAGRPLVSGLTSRIFIGRAGQGGFIASWVPGTSGPQNPLWVLVGRGVRIHNDILDAILNPDPRATNSGDIQQYLDAGGGDAILPRGSTSGRTDLNTWVLAAAFQFDPFFQVKVLISDAGYAGLTLSGGALPKVLGISGLSVLYVRGRVPAEDRFALAIALPRFEFAAFSFLGGTLRVEVSPSGNFLFDFGFPWMRKSGLREWDRTVGAMVSGLQASGGFYIERRVSDVVSNGAITTRMGYAVQWGVGGIASFGPARASFRAGYFAVVEGLAVLSAASFDLNELQLRGSGGVLVQAEVSVNLWIVSAYVSVLASAEVLVAVDWKSHALTGGRQKEALIAPGTTTKDITIELRLVVGVMIHAEITVDFWLDSVTYRADFEISVDMSTHIKVG